MKKTNTRSTSSQNVKFSNFTSPIKNISAKSDVQVIEKDGSVNGKVLNQYAKSFTQKMHAEIGQGRCILRSLSNAERVLILENKANSILEAIVKYKQECRMFLKSTIESSKSKPLPRQHSTNTRTEIKGDHDEDLDLFEDNFSGLEDLDICNQLDMLLDLLILRDKLFQKICISHVESISVDTMSHEPIPDGCPREIEKLFVIFNSFRCMQGTIRKFDLSKDQLKKANEIISMQVRIENQQQQLYESEERFEQLLVEHRTMISDYGKAAVFLRLQTTVDASEKEKEVLKNEVQSLQSELRRTRQDKFVVLDKLQLVSTELKKLRAAYRRDLAHIRPMMEEQMTQLQEEVRTMQVISQGCELSVVRERTLISSHDKVLAEMETLRTRLNEVGYELQLEQKRNQHLESAMKRKGRMSHVIVAAELSTRQELQRLKLELQNVNLEKENLLKQVESLQSQLLHSESVIKQQEMTIKSMQEDEIEFKRRLAISEVDLKASEITLNYFKDEMGRMQGRRSPVKTKFEHVRQQRILSDDDENQGPAAMLKAIPAAAAVFDAVSFAISRSDMTDPILGPDLESEPSSSGHDPRVFSRDCDDC